MAISKMITCIVATVGYRPVIDMTPSSRIMPGERMDPCNLHTLNGCENAPPKEI